MQKLHWSGETKPNLVLIEQGDGKTMKRFTWPSEETKVQNDCSNWAPGVYIVKVIDQQGKIHSRKLVVQYNLELLEAAILTIIAAFLFQSFQQSFQYAIKFDITTGK